MSINKEIILKVNGEKRKVIITPSELLSDVLRYKLGFKSLKEGCGRGDCGTCTVLVDGKSVRSCLILAIELSDNEITTLEGLGENGLKLFRSYKAKDLSSLNSTNYEKSLNPVFKFFIDLHGIWPDRYHR